MATNLPITGNFEITAVFKQENSKLWKILGFHTGIDFIGNDNIYATCNGVVDSISYSDAFGNYIIIKENEADRYHYFCHLKKVIIRKGANVNRTTIIGIMGETGNVTGKHLHYEIRKEKGNLVESNLIDPAAYCGIPNKKGKYNSDNYQSTELIIENEGKYHAGQVVEIKVPVKVAYNNGTKSIVDDCKNQFWIHNSVIEDRNIHARCIIAFAQGTSYIVQVFDDQFWVEETNIVKEL